MVKFRCSTKLKLGPGRGEGGRGELWRPDGIPSSSLTEKVGSYIAHDPVGADGTSTVTALALPILIGLGARWSARATLDELTATNIRLTVENENFREATGQLASQIAALQTAVDEIGATADVDPAVSRAMERLPASVRSRAMGGNLAAAVIDNAIAPGDTAFGVMREVLGAIEDRLDAVKSGVERRRSLADATPSIWPVAGWLTSAFGSRRDPFTGDRNFHPGLDISASYGNPVFAPATGKIAVYGQTSGNSGNLVVIDHGYGSRDQVRPPVEVRRVPTVSRSIVAT